MAKVTFLKAHQCAEVPSGTELKDLHLYLPQAPLRFGCLHGECGTCAFKTTGESNNLSKPTRQEIITLTKKNLLNTHRLACQCAIIADLLIE